MILFSRKIARILCLGCVLFGLFLLTGCGTDNPFARGPEIENGGSLPPPGADVSFSSNVAPILSSCTACHASGAGGWTYNGGSGRHAAVLSVIDLDNPENSLLLIKATGGNGHGGGRLFATSSEQYQVILNWIQQGAENN